MQPPPARRAPGVRNGLVDLRLLKVFLAVTDHGSMTASAKRLGLTQGAVSQSIRKLEDELQVALFHHSRRPLKLTAAGQVLRQRATTLIAEAEQLPSLIQELGRSRVAEFKIGLSASFAAAAVPALIRDLMTMATKLSICTGSITSCARAVLDGTLDAGITSDPLADSDGLDRIPLMREPLLLLLPSQYPAEVQRKTLAQLAAEFPLIRYNAVLGAKIDRHLRQLKISAPRTIDVDDSETLIALVADNQGWAVTTPLCLLQGRQHAKQVRAIKLPGPAATRDILLVVRTGEYAELPNRIAHAARRILRQAENTEIRQLVPWLTQTLVMGFDGQ
jgi:DNA-binding transcriptional LysR family regulator